MAASQAMTWAQAWIKAWGMTGLTLPGMMELPGWTSGSASSPRPARGPDPSQLMSLAIFCRLTATVRRLAPAPRAGVAQEPLAQADGRRVLEMRAPGLDHAPELLRFLLERLAQPLQRRNQ